MSLFFETLRVIQGEVQNLPFHNERVNRTRYAHFNNASKIDIEAHIHQTDPTLERCKVCYHDSIISVEFAPLIKREFQSFKILESDITYNFKNVDREEIDALVSQKESCDDILILKDGYVTDTSIANIAYHDGTRWITPKNPLLLGTMRESLIKRQLLLEKDVKIEDIKKASRFAIMNALIGFHEIKAVKFL